MPYELITKYKRENITSYITITDVNDIMEECKRIHGREFDTCTLIQTGRSDGINKEFKVNVDHPADTIRQLD